MAEIREGARVRVEFEGEVTWANPHGDVEVRIDGTKVTAETHVDWCTVIVPPIKVGDKVDRSNIDQLPDRSVIASDNGAAWLLMADYWHFGEQDMDSREVCARGDQRVLRIGGGS